MWTSPPALIVHPTPQKHPGGKKSRPVRTLCTHLSQGQQVPVAHAHGVRQVQAGEAGEAVAEGAHVLQALRPDVRHVVVRRVAPCTADLSKASRRRFSPNRTRDGQLSAANIPFKCVWQQENECLFDAVLHEGTVTHCS